MLPILQIGPLAIQLPGLLLIAGVWAGSLLAERAARAQQLSGSKVSNLIFYALLAGICAARLGYALRFFDLYRQEPLGIFALNLNTLSLSEGLAGAVVAALIYGRRAQLAFWRTLDALTPGLAVFMLFLALAQLASGDAFGAETELPWAIELWGARRHPTQVYSLLTAGILLLIVLRLSRSSRFPGFLFLAFTVLTAGQRYLIEAFRGDSQIVLGVLRSAQVVSLLLLLAGLTGLHIRARQTLSPAPLDSGLQEENTRPSDLVGGL